MIMFACRSHKTVCGESFITPRAAAMAITYCMLAPDAHRATVRSMFDLMHLGRLEEI